MPQNVSRMQRKRVCPVTNQPLLYRTQMTRTSSMTRSLTEINVPGTTRIAQEEGGAVNEQTFTGEET